MAPARDRRQHTLSIDDAPFDKYRDEQTWAVGVVMAGGGLVEGVMTTRLVVDGAEITARLAEWIRRSRFFPSLRAVFLEGITIAGLSVIHLPRLAAAIRVPVISVDRKLPQPGRLEAALRKLGMDERVEAVRAAGPFHASGGIVFTCAGTTPATALGLLEQSHVRSRLPEGIRLAHLIAQAIALGESKGRV